MSSLSGYQFLGLSPTSFVLCVLSHILFVKFVGNTAFSHYDLISVTKKVFCPFIQQFMVNTYIIIYSKYFAVSDFLKASS